MPGENDPIAMNEEQLKKFIKTAKVVNAEDDLIQSNQKNVNVLLALIGKQMGHDDNDDEDDNKEFVRRCFVSDMSELNDFHLNESELVELSLQLGFDVGRNDLIFAVAAKMPGGCQ